MILRLLLWGAVYWFLFAEARLVQCCCCDAAPGLDG